MNVSKQSIHLDCSSSGLERDGSSVRMSRHNVSGEMKGEARPRIKDRALMLVSCAKICVVIIVFLLPGRPALANVRTAQVSWVCWHNNSSAVICQFFSIDDANSAGMTDSTDKAMPWTSATDPLYTSLPPLVNAILHDPASLKGRRISIPTYSAPEDRVFMIELAEAVMCGVKPNCTVHFLNEVSEIAQFLEAVEDAALN